MSEKNFLKYIENSGYELILGLEVHAQLSTTTKAWCGCEINPLAGENTTVCEVCAGHPGTLPVANQKAIEYAVLMGLAVGGEIVPLSFYDRKNYFYPDLPKGYQITQFSTPIVENGTIEVDDEFTGETKKIRIQRIQLEEDAGKSIHEGKFSYINLNRSGTPLIEIISLPDLRGPKEASQYLKKLHATLVYLNICRGNLQDGNFRCDVNVSLRKIGETRFGTRSEVKNLNSFRNVEKAIEAEAIRQLALYQAGKTVEQETMGFDAVKSETYPIRKKSDAHDYRYFPEPDLLPISITPKQIEVWKSQLPELPEQKTKRFMSEYSLNKEDSMLLTQSQEMANYFEDCVKGTQSSAKKVANWLTTELLRLLNEYSITIEKTRVTASEISALLELVHEAKISSKQAKEVSQIMFDEQRGALEVVQKLGLEQLSDSDALEEIVDAVLDECPLEVERFLNGEKKLTGFFVGQIMKKSKGQANPGKVNKILSEKLAMKLKK